MCVVWNRDDERALCGPGSDHTGKQDTRCAACGDRLSFPYAVWMGWCSYDGGCMMEIFFCSECDGARGVLQDLKELSHHQTVWHGRKRLIAMRTDGMVAQ